jgi:C-terminal processing protease CtpA/Prc
MKLEAVVAAIVVGALSACTAHRSSAAARDGLADYGELKTALERSYSNLAWFGSVEGGVDLPELDARTRASLERAQNEAEARQALTAFVNVFQDGHLSVMPEVEPRAGAASVDPPMPPFEGMSAEQVCAALGYAATSRVSFSLPFESLPGFRLDADGMSTASRAGVARTGQRRIGIIRIAYFRARNHPAECVRAVTELRHRSAPLSKGAISDAAEQAWFESIAAQLKKLRAEAVDAVLVDVGGNTGGDDSGDWAARLFTEKPVRSARMLVSASSVANGYFDEQLKAFAAAKAMSPPADAASALDAAQTLFDRGKQACARNECDLSWVWRERRRWARLPCNRLVDVGFAAGPLAVLPADAFGNREIAASLHWPVRVSRSWGAWSGPTYVFTDSKTYSSAELFSATMRDNEIAKTIGTRTGGAGCGTVAETPPVMLSRVHLTVRFPTCVRLRANGTDEVAGIVPDLPLAPRDGEGQRARAVRALSAIEADLSR